MVRCKSAAARASQEKLSGSFGISRVSARDAGGAGRGQIRGGRGEGGADGVKVQPFQRERAFQPRQRVAAQAQRAAAGQQRALGGDVAQLQPIGEEAATLGQHGIEAAQPGLVEAERQPRAGAGKRLRHLAAQRGGGTQMADGQRHRQGTALQRACQRADLAIEGEGFAAALAAQGKLRRLVGGGDMQPGLAECQHRRQAGRAQGEGQILGAGGLAGAIAHQPAVQANGAKPWPWLAQQGGEGSRVGQVGGDVEMIGGEAARLAHLALGLDLAPGQFGPQTQRPGGAGGAQQPRQRAGLGIEGDGKRAPAQRAIEGEVAMADGIDPGDGHTALGRGGEAQPGIANGDDADFGQRVITPLGGLGGGAGLGRGGAAELPVWHAIHCLQQDIGPLQFQSAQHDAAGEQRQQFDHHRHLGHPQHIGPAAAGEVGEGDIAQGDARRQAQREAHAAKPRTAPGGALQGGDDGRAKALRIQQGEGDGATGQQQYGEAGGGPAGRGPGTRCAPEHANGF